MTPFFSVILPVYNVETYLERCVNSLLRQKFTDYEIILVDDGSTDNSGRLCDTLAQAYPFIRVIHKENGGLASARNAGMQEAKGQYIWFVDSDDWIEEDALHSLYHATAEEKPDVTKFSYVRVEKDFTPVLSNAKPGCYRGEALKKLLDLAFYRTGKFVLSACTHIYRTQFLQEHGFSFVSERLVGSEDYLFNIEVLVHAQCVCVIPDLLYYYEQRMGSLTQQYKKNLPGRYESLYKNICEKLENAGKMQEYGKKIASFYMWHLMHGTCIPNEYYITEHHTLPEGRKNIRKLSRSGALRHAYSHYDRTAFGLKKRLQLWAMRMGMEPLFYWLYVVKPRRKKGNVHENQD